MVGPGSKYAKHCAMLPPPPRSANFTLKCCISDQDLTGQDGNKNADDLGDKNLHYIFRPETFERLHAIILGIKEV